MEDMAAKINGILQDPESMRQLQELAGLFAAGTGGDPGLPSVSEAAESARAAPGNAPGHSPEPSVPFGTPSLSPDLLQTVNRLMPILNGMQEDTETTRFLQALRPLLSEPRRQRLDEASKLLQVFRLLPLLRDRGLWQGP